MQKINLKTNVVPNFFSKEHVENFLKRKLKKGEFENIKEYIEENLMDKISELVYLEIQDWENQQLLNKKAVKV